MRLISFFLTTRQFQDGTKDVTRRLGWGNLVPGQRLMAVRKAQGLRKGEEVERLGEIEVVSVGQELLQDITADDCRREGFPHLTPKEFIDMFCDHMLCLPETVVNRIEFKRVEVPRG